MNDRQGVVDELVAKLDAIFEANRDQNFLTEMYAGQLEINCSPPFGTLDYYNCMENDAARALCKIVSPSDESPTGFVTGKAFLDCVRIVLAKISILDWTSMDKSTQHLVVADTKQKLPGILRTGCHVSLPLVADKVIPSHLKEDVLQVGSRERLVVSLGELCEEYPGFIVKWVALNDLVHLDRIKDEDLDMGFDVTSLIGKKESKEMVSKKIGELFQFFLTLRGKTYESSRLTTEDQSDFDAFTAFVLRRRKTKVSRWLRGALGDHLSEVCTQLEQRHAEPLVVYMSRCQQRCTNCQLGCMRSMTHSSEIEHNCCTDHKCRGECEYGECQATCESTAAPPCSRSAGHEGKCECKKGEHTCGQPCALTRASNCDKRCVKRAEHSGDHCCSVQVHVCGAKCSAATCAAPCLLDIQREHTVHNCAEVQCLHPCLMEGCKHLCGEKNHFHGQAAESRAFAEESGAHCDEDSDDDLVVTHMCSGSHACGEMCTVDGICEQKVHLKKDARMYTGARGSFEYIYQEMNGCKKHCVHVLPSGQVDHDGFGHSCLAQSSSGDDEEPNTVHYCDARCPSCNYYCNKHFGHLGLHATSHGNMRQTYFMAKGNDIDVEDRKYQVGERGIAEMCNLFCSKMGRGHVHYYPCESKDGEKCVYTSADASADQRRHCVDNLFPPPDKEMDELLHAKFWASIGWEDPCSDEERALFAKCPFQCDAPEHEEGDTKPSHCLLDAWHLPELKPEADDGFAYIDGHKFECVHAVDSGKFHNIFVLDSSGSMSGQPWQDLLHACNDNQSHIYCEGGRLSESLQTPIPYSGGGTCFEEGLRAANEVLSRNDVQEFKAVLIFFSDGRPWDIDLAVTLAKHIRHTYAKYDVKAFVVGFGCVNLSVLERMATEMGGEYRHALDADALRTEFQRIAAVLCSSEASLALLESS
ncbi:hypothetical protein PHYPSEUDO_009758 [Phytophthora pseudosyringae]|uniref:VWFA domain-containing protein n=1 Tax=Phytophthora pseudosyringae TaxID=221518 RepID=A0A8T1VEV4_9STRA|nr:hypothetical protein PHYPSEUDO_009758 [Phytophthora pseudosyringae]